MKITYVCFWNAFVQDGVARKINAQTSTWRELGHHVDVLCLSPAPSNGTPQVLDGHVFGYDRSWRRPVATRSMFGAAKSSGADVLYLRADNFLPTPGGLLRAVPGVVELNGSEVYSRAGRPLPYRVYSHVNQYLTESRARGLVSVTYSLARGERHFGTEVEVVPNAVDLDEHQPLPAPDNEAPHFVLLAGAQNTAHGVDKVLELARSLPDCRFTLIGRERHQLPAEPTDNVEVHGLMPKEEYEPLLARADVAIGPVALDRTGLDEASALKVAEYLAYGLPTIVGYQETNFVGREEPWYMLRLPRTDDNVRAHTQEIRAFADSVMGTRIDRAEVEELVGITTTEQRRLAFMERVSGAEAPAGKH